MTKKGTGATASSEMHDEIRAIRKDLSVILKQQELITKQQATIESLVNEIQALKEERSKQTKDIAELQKRVDELEQYTRADDVVISGLNIQAQSYAAAASSTEERNEDAPQQETFILEEKLCQALEEHSIILKSENISTCHFLGGPNRNRNGNRNIIVRFSNRKEKDSLLKAARNHLPGTNIYINEHLTQKNAYLARFARQLRKDKLINQTWTRNGKSFVKWQSNINGQMSTTKIIEETDFLKCDITEDQLRTTRHKLTSTRPRNQNGSN